MSGTMRGVYTNLTEIRRRVFAEVARIAYASANEKGEASVDDTAAQLQQLPYEIVPGDVATYRESVFLERAIVQERIRLAMGLPLQDLDRPGDGLRPASRRPSCPETYYEPPAGQRHQVCLQRLRGQRLPRDAQRLPGLPGAPLPRDLPQGRHLVQGQEGVHRPRQVHQVRPLRQRVPLPRHSPPRAPLRRRVRHARDWL